jgi:hypothetical protein
MAKLESHPECQRLIAIAYAAQMDLQKARKDVRDWLEQHKGDSNG